MIINLTPDDADFLRDVIAKEKDKAAVALGKATAEHARRARKREIRSCDAILGQLAETPGQVESTS